MVISPSQPSPRATLQVRQVDAIVDLAGEDEGAAGGNIGDVQRDKVAGAAAAVRQRRPRGGRTRSRREAVHFRALGRLSRNLHGRLGQRPYGELSGFNRTPGPPLRVSPLSRKITPALSKAC